MSNHRNRFLGALIINDATREDEMLVASSDANALRIRVWNGLHTSSIYLSAADEAALLAYLQERAGERS